MAKIVWMDDRATDGDKNERLGFDALMYYIDKNGHQVEVAATSRQMETVLSEIGVYDLLILDIIMDPISSSSNIDSPYGGIDVLAELHKLESKTPIIILSVMPSRIIREEAASRNLDLEEIGVKEIMRKGSLTPTELASKVNKHLR